MEVAQNSGCHFGGPSDKSYHSLGSILGYPYLEIPTYPSRERLALAGGARAGRKIDLEIESYLLWGRSITRAPARS